MKQNMEPESSFLRWELHDDTTRKHSLKQTLFFLACFLMAGFGLWQFVKETPVASLNAAEELQVGSVDVAVPVKKDVTTNSITEILPHLDTEWAEIKVIKGGVSEMVVDLLEHDVFERLDLNKDGQLDALEIREFIQSGIYQIMKTLTVSDMKKLRKNMKYPVNEITEDMSSEEIDELCNEELALEGVDIGAEFEKAYGDDPALFMADLIDSVDALVGKANGHVHMKFGGFKDIVERPASKHEKSETIVIPAECDGRRRLGNNVATMRNHCYFCYVQMSNNEYWNAQSQLVRAISTVLGQLSDKCRRNGDTECTDVERCAEANGLSTCYDLLKE